MLVLSRHRDERIVASNLLGSLIEEARTRHSLAEQYSLTDEIVDAVREEIDWFLQRLELLDKRVTVTVVDICGDKVRLGVDAPNHIAVHRAEVQAKVDREQGVAS